MIIKKRGKILKKHLSYKEFYKIRNHRIDELVEKKELIKEILKIDIFNIYCWLAIYDDLEILEIQKKKFLIWLNKVKYCYNKPEAYRNSFYIYSSHQFEDYLHNDNRTRLDSGFYSDEELTYIDEIVKQRREEIEKQ